MNKSVAVDQAYRIATLAEPTEEIRQILYAENFERVLELLLILRGWENVRNPAGFLRRAIQEGWTASTTPEKVNRRLENHEKRYYMRRGLTEDQAQARVVEDRHKEGW